MQDNFYKLSAYVSTGVIESGTSMGEIIMKNLLNLVCIEHSICKIHYEEPVIKMSHLIILTIKLPEKIHEFRTNII